MQLQPSCDILQSKYIYFHWGKFELINARAGLHRCHDYSHESVYLHSSLLELIRPDATPRVTQKYVSILNGLYLNIKFPFTLILCKIAMYNFYETPCLSLSILIYHVFLTVYINWFMLTRNTVSFLNKSSNEITFLWIYSATQHTWPIQTVVPLLWKLKKYTKSKPGDMDI